MTIEFPLSDSASHLHTADLATHTSSFSSSSSASSANKVQSKSTSAFSEKPHQIPIPPSDIQTPHIMPNSLAKPPAKQKACWATLMTGDAYMPGLAVFAHSLLRSPHASAYPLVVMTVRNSCSPDAIQTVRELGCEVVEVERMGYSDSTRPENLAAERFSEVWTKLKAWELDKEGYERVILVDSDMLVRRNMDELFEMELPPNGPLGIEGIAASSVCTCNPQNVKTYPANWIPENCPFTPQVHPSCLSSGIELTESSPPTHYLLNSGLVVLHPSSEIMKIMAHEIATSPKIKTYRFPDQDFLSDFYAGAYKPISYIYNALKKLRSVHPGMWRDEEVKNVHYILNKPWHGGSGNSNPYASTTSTNTPPGASSSTNSAISNGPKKLVKRGPGRDLGGPDEVTHGWWWEEWSRCQRDLAGGVTPARWVDCVEKFVADDQEVEVDV